MTSLTARLRELIALETPHATALRRDLHTHPEICYEELRTCARLRDELAKAGITRSDGLAGGTGTIAFLPGKAARAVGLRADIDGLPIHEATSEGCGMSVVVGV